MNKLNTKGHFKKSLGRSIGFILMIVLCITSINCIKASAEEIPSVTVTKKTLYRGYKNYRIKFKNLPEDAVITYVSSAKKIASVSTKGLVKPLKAGKAKITVSITTGEDCYTSVITITVKEPYIKFIEKAEQLEFLDEVQETEHFLFKVKTYGLKNPDVRFSLDGEDPRGIIDSLTGEFFGTRLGAVDIIAKDEKSGKQAVCNCEITEKTDNREAILTIDGDYAYFGFYPQTEITSAKLIAKLEKLDFKNNYLQELDGVVYIREDERAGGIMKKGDVKYFIYEPIKWRILEKSKTTITLMSEYNLENYRYCPQDVYMCSWKDSDLRQWLNATEDYENRKSFANSAFSANELEAIKAVDVDGQKDKIYIPKQSDVVKKSYGFASDPGKSETRICYSTDYAMMMGSLDMDGKAVWWWLRTIGKGSDGMTDGGMAFVYGGGRVCDSGNKGDNPAYGVRPMINVDISKCTVKE